MNRSLRPGLRGVESFKFKTSNESRRAASEAEYYADKSIGLGPGRERVFGMLVFSISPKVLPYRYSV